MSEMENNTWQYVGPQQLDQASVGDDGGQRGRRDV